MSTRGKSRKSTAATHEAEVFARLSRGESHTSIADEMGMSRSHVTRIAAKFRDRLAEQAEQMKQAAVDGAAEAKRLAREHAPEAVRALVREMRTADESSDRRAAAVAILDRGGVKPGVEVSGEGFDALAAALLGAKRSVGEDGEA